MSSYRAHIDYTLFYIFIHVDFLVIFYHLYPSYTPFHIHAPLHMPCTFYNPNIFHHQPLFPIIYYITIISAYIYLPYFSSPFFLHHISFLPFILYSFFTPPLHFTIIHSITHSYNSLPPHLNSPITPSFALIFIFPSQLFFITLYFSYPPPS